MYRYRGRFVDKLMDLDIIKYIYIYKSTIIPIGRHRYIKGFIPGANAAEMHLYRDSGIYI